MTTKGFIRDFIPYFWNYMLSSGTGGDFIKYSLRRSWAAHKIIFHGSLCILLPSAEGARLKSVSQLVIVRTQCKRCVLSSDKLSEWGCNATRFWSLVVSAVSASWYRIKFRLKISDSNKVCNSYQLKASRTLTPAFHHSNRSHSLIRWVSRAQNYASQLKNKNIENPFDCSIPVSLDWILIENATAKMDCRQFSGRVFRTKSNQSKITESNIAKLCK